MNPMLAETAEPRQIESGLFIKSAAWAIQVKIDGDRRLVECDGAGGVTIRGRDGQPTGLPAAILDPLRRVNLPVTLDGELLSGVLCVWEAPRLGDQITPASECIDRITAGFAVVEAIGSDLIRSVPTALTTDQKIALVERVTAGRGEGIMAKLTASPYVPRRAATWRKVKRRHTIDCVVSWLGDDKANMGVHVYDGHGNKIDLGEVGRLSGDGQLVREGDVVEVTCLYVTDGNRLYQPTYPKRRTDKAPGECTTEQLDAARTDKNLILNWKAA